MKSALLGVQADGDSLENEQCWPGWRPHIIENDTVGEFAGIARDSGFRLPVAPILPGVRPIGRWREFANSITFDGQ
jgi:hypothetical protein